MTAIVLFFLVAKQSYSCQGHLPVEASRSHSDTQHSVGLLWTSDRPVAETFTCTTHKIHNRHTSMLPVGFEPAIPASERPQAYILYSAWPPRVPIVYIVLGHRECQWYYYFHQNLDYMSNNVLSTTNSVMCIYSVYRHIRL
jgi:hypothetical protein